MVFKDTAWILGMHAFDEGSSGTLDELVAPQDSHMVARRPYRRHACGIDGESPQRRDVGQFRVDNGVGHTGCDGDKRGGPLLLNGLVSTNHLGIQHDGWGRMGRCQGEEGRHGRIRVRQHEAGDDTTHGVPNDYDRRRVVVQGQDVLDHVVAVFGLVIQKLPVDPRKRVVQVHFFFFFGHA